MQIIKQSWSLEGVTVPIFDRGNDQLGLNIDHEGALADGALQLIEKSGRTCYKTEGLMGDIEKTRQFVGDKIKRGHYSILEHVSICVRAITDRGVTHELVRHRIGSYSQESTRYCNYSKDKFGSEITVILPVEFYGIYQEDLAKALQQESFDSGEALWQRFDGQNSELKKIYAQFFVWHRSCLQAQKNYFEMIEHGALAQLARSIIVHSLKVEIVVTFNVRQWRHFFALRDHAAAHPQMRELAASMHAQFQKYFPVLFDA